GRREIGLRAGEDCLQIAVVRWQDRDWPVLGRFEVAPAADAFLRQHRQAKSRGSGIPAGRYERFRGRDRMVRPGEQRGYGHAARLEVQTPHDVTARKCLTRPTPGTLTPKRDAIFRGGARSLSPVVKSYEIRSDSMRLDFVCRGRHGG